MDWTAGLQAYNKSSPGLIICRVRHHSDELRYVCYLFRFSYIFAEYSTILIFVTLYAYQMQIDELFALTRGAFLV